MKQNVLLTLIVICGLVVTTSCSSVKGIFGKSSSQETKQAGKIDNVQKAQKRNADAKMDNVAVLASGTGYALDKVENGELAVDIAKDLNKRVESLAGKPDLDAEKEMWKLIDNLTSSNATLRAQGIKGLEKKDLEIKLVQEETRTLLTAKDLEIDKYMRLSKDNALLADTRKAELSEYQGFWGLSAVGKGLWQFVSTLAWWLLGGSVVFFILRFASMSNPIAASIFGVLEHMVSWVINTIAVIFPKALNMAGTVSKDLYNSSQALLKKIIDSLQNLKDLQTKLGHDITLKELFVELDKSMDANEKEVISKIKKELGY